MNRKNIHLGPTDAAIVLRGNGTLDVVTPARSDELHARVTAPGFDPETLSDEDGSAMQAAVAIKVVEFFVTSPVLLSLARGIMTGDVEFMNMPQTEREMPPADSLEWN